MVDYLTLAVAVLWIGHPPSPRQHLATVLDATVLSLVEESTAADRIELGADQIDRLNNLTPAAGERHEDGVMAAIDR